MKEKYRSYTWESGVIFKEKDLRVIFCRSSWEDYKMVYLNLVTQYKVKSGLLPTVIIAMSTLFYFVGAWKSSVNFTNLHVLSCIYVFNFDACSTKFHIHKEVWTYKSIKAQHFVQCCAQKQEWFFKDLAEKHCWVSPRNSCADLLMEYKVFLMHFETI